MNTQKIYRLGIDNIQETSDHFSNIYEQSRIFIDPAQTLDKKTLHFNHYIGSG